MKKKKPVVSIIMGSKSDLPYMKGAGTILEELKVPFEVKIVSAHRTPLYMKNHSLSAKKKGIKVIIAGAGGAAHLPGMTASMTVLPVIGVPVESKALKGLDSLLSIAQMPQGVPVASMAVNGSFNAGLMAARILSLSDLALSKRLKVFQKKQASKTLSSNKDLEFFSFLKKRNKK